MKLYCVIWRQGGTHRAIWSRTIAMGLETAIRFARDVERMGYKALVEDYNLSLSIGLPQGWEP